LLRWRQQLKRRSRVKREQQQVLRAVLQRSTVDRAFRRKLLTDPRTAIEQAFGVRIPDQYRIRFVERDADVDALIVLPDFSADGTDSCDDELSDSELEHVAGGSQDADIDELESEEEMTWADEAY
jgi:hypothetical protein